MIAIIMNFHFYKLSTKHFTHNEKVATVCGKMAHDSCNFDSVYTVIESHSFSSLTHFAARAQHVWQYQAPP